MDNLIAGLILIVILSLLAYGFKKLAESFRGADEGQCGYCDYVGHQQDCQFVDRNCKKLNFPTSNSESKS